MITLSDSQIRALERQWQRPVVRACICKTHAEAEEHRSEFDFSFGGHGGWILIKFGPQATQAEREESWLD
jgi:hypothetical protein